jgi:hypothetical protein
MRFANRKREGCRDATAVKSSGWLMALKALAQREHYCAGWVEAEVGVER